MDKKFNKKILIKLILIIILPFAAFLIMHILINYIQKPICLWKILFHIDCPGCGLTRAFYQLFKLNFYAAWQYNYKIFIVAPILLYIWIKEISNLLKKIH